MVKKSPTAETKKLIFQLLSSHPKRVFTLSEIKEWCLENEPEGFTTGVLSGALRSVSRADNSKIRSEERGKYFYDPDYTPKVTDNNMITPQVADINVITQQVADIDEISPQVALVLEGALEQIKKIMYNVDILTLTAEDIGKIQKIKAAMESVSQIKEGLKSNNN